MLRLVTLAFLLSCSLNCIAADKSGRFTVLSMGNKSCGEFSANFRGNGIEKLGNSIWVAGYMTAFNEYIAKQSNIAAGTDPEAWNLWINNYCNANPLESLSTATSELVAELSRRNR